MENVEAITKHLIDTSFDYLQYRSHLEELMAQNKTTGDNQEDWIIDYARLNIARMNRLDKMYLPTIQLQNQLRAVKVPLVMLTVTEGWCGDAAQILPIVEKLVQIIPFAAHKLILRDQHPQVMDAFLTNGKSRSIPITVFLKADSLEVLGKWGPRPSGAQQLMDELGAQKANFDIIKRELHGWYAKDKGEQTAAQFTETLMHAIVK